MRYGSYRPAPSVWDGMPVPDKDAFFSLTRPPGWKYELWDGQLRIEPDWRYEVARWVGPVPEAMSPRADVRLGPPDSASVESLADLADRAFARSPDFFAAPEASRWNHLHGSIKDALDLEPDWVRRLGRVARSADRYVVGLVLTREVEGGVTLDTVAVHPDWQRRGVGSSLLAGVRQALPDGVDLRSAWLVANRESARWHLSNGFHILPTSVSQRSRLAAEMWAERATLRTRIEAEQAIREQEDAEREGRVPNPLTFARPIHRRRPA